MRVLQINATYGTGSTGEIICGIAESGSQYGIETFFAISNSAVKSSDGKVFTIGNLFDHKVHAICSRVFGSQGQYSFMATRRLLKWIDQIKPDIIHLHNIHNNYININLLFKYIKNNKIQTVITLHDCWFFTGKCCHFLYDNCNKWITVCGKCPRKKKEIPSYFFDRSTADFEKKRILIGDNIYVHVVGCSEWLTECARKSLLKNRVEKTIYNGIDLNIFFPRNSTINSELCLEHKFVILGMANKWLSEDNVETFEYITSHLDNSMVLLLLGCTKEQIHRNKSNKNIIMKGFTRDRQELANYYSKADVFVNVTKVDSFPTVNIESIACGTPVITYDSGGSKETIDHETGIVVPYGDYETLFKCIKIVQRNGKGAYTEKCCQRARRLYNKEERFAEYAELYTKLISK